MSTGSSSLGSEPHHSRVAPRSLRLPVQAPFHLEATARVLQRRPSHPVDRWEQGRYRRVFEQAGKLVLAEVENRGTIDDPDVRCAIRHGRASATTKKAIEARLRRVLGLDVASAPLQRLAKIDRALTPYVRALRGMRPPRFASLFEAFASVIPFQQLSLEAGVSIVGRFVARFGTPLEYDGERYYTFPTAASCADARISRLQACGLSKTKAQTMRAIARTIASGALTEAELSKMDTREALRRLVDVPGIGPWSAGLVMLRGMGRLDVFPPGDAGASRGLGALLKLAPEVALDDVVERFGPQRGYLYFCGLGANLLARGLIHPAPAE